MQSGSTDTPKILEDLLVLFNQQQAEIKKLKDDAAQRSASASQGTSDNQNLLSSIKEIVDISLSRRYGEDSDPENLDSSDDDPQEEDELQKTYNDSVSDAVPTDADDPMGPPINPSLAKALDHWFHNIHTGGEIQEALKSVKRPENATALKQVVVNDEVKKSMSRQDWIKDQKLKWPGGVRPLRTPLEPPLQIKKFTKDPNNTSHSH